MAPPKSLLDCQDEPQPPARPGPGLPRDQRDIALYIVELRHAGEDCRQNLRALKRWAEGELAPDAAP